MTDQEKRYLQHARRVLEQNGPMENESSIPAPFAGEEVDAAWEIDQTMGNLNEALESATDGDEYIAVDDPYDGESDAPGQPS